MISGKRRFEINDQMRFSKLSGDFNPLHLDSLAARRSLTGGTVVHGIHLLFWALDAWCATFTEKSTLITLDVEFIKSVPVGSNVHLSGSVYAAGAEIALYVGDQLATTIAFRVRHGADAFIIEPGRPPISAPSVLDKCLISAAEGKLPLVLDRLLASQLAPSLLRVLPPRQIAFMLSTSRLVGMECPGLNSLYASLNFTESEGAVESEEWLAYRVKRFDKRFSLSTILLAGPGLVGNIKAFLRPEPQVQPTCQEVRAAIDVGTLSGKPFYGQRVLVIGGSRGLGEVFTKVLAMCGAEVLFTYHKGEQESAAIVSDIIASKGKAACLKYDVIRDKGEIFAEFAANHLIYMATPFINIGRQKKFNSQAFVSFCNYYVDGFAATFDGACHQGLASVYYPSSIFLDELPLQMSEYIAAKGAGEALCSTLAKAFPEIKFVCPRLPRIATDQSASLVKSANKPMLPLVLAQVEQLIQRTK